MDGFIKNGFSIRNMFSLKYPKKKDIPKMKKEAA
jgi:hypothetical protein